MSKRFIILLVATLSLAFSAAAGPSSAGACEAVIVTSADLRPYLEALRGFQDACTCEVREIPAKDGDLLESIHLEPPDVVVAIGTTAFKKVKALKNLPIVYLMVVSSETERSMDPNISGVSMDIAPGVTFAAMKDILHGAKRVGLLYDPRHTRSFVEDAARAATSSGIELTVKQVHDPSEIASALNSMQDKIDLLWMLPDPTVMADETVDYLLRFSIQHHIPIFTFSKKYVEMGAVASLDMDPYDMGAQAAEMVSQKAAGGAKAVRVYARTARPSINEKAVKRLWLKIADEMPKKADTRE